MKPGIALVALLATTCSVGISLGQDDKTDQEKLQGTWNVVAMERDGRGAPQAYCQTLVVSFAGDKISLKRKDGVGPTIEHTFKLDPTKTPKVMDLVVPDGSLKGKVLLGIYAFEGALLKMCHTDAGATERPTEFRSPAGTFLSVVTVTRPPK